MVEAELEISRIAKALFDRSGKDWEETVAFLRQLRVSIVCGKDAVQSRSGQAAILTAVATSVRCFLGGVELVAPDCTLLLPAPLKPTLLESAALLGAEIVSRPTADRRLLLGALPAGDKFAVRVGTERWKATVGLSSDSSYKLSSEISLTGIAAGALAVSEAFAHVQGMRIAGRRRITLDLWSPGATDDVPPSTILLPRKIWLVGLGNLGQAYLWALGLLPYANPREVELVLQDPQNIAPENWGTSLLVHQGQYGSTKARLAADWAERVGFRTTIVERAIDASTRRSDQEPVFALAGLDSIPARRLLGGMGFHSIMDVGLGATHRDFRELRLTLFAGEANPATHWPDGHPEIDHKSRELLETPGYRELQKKDRCGAATLAGASVAAPFTGAAVGALAVAQIVRAANGFLPYLSVRGDLSDLGAIQSRQANAPLGSIGLTHSRSLLH